MTTTDPVDRDTLANSWIDLANANTDIEGVEVTTLRPAPALADIVAGMTRKTPDMAPVQWAWAHDSGDIRAFALVKDGKVDPDGEWHEVDADAFRAALAKATEEAAMGEG